VPAAVEHTAAAAAAAAAVIAPVLGAYGHQVSSCIAGLRDKVKCDELEVIIDQHPVVGRISNNRCPAAAAHTKLDALTAAAASRECAQLLQD
jgi:hypothetical protein